MPLRAPVGVESDPVAARDFNRRPGGEIAAHAIHTANPPLLLALAVHYEDLRLPAETVRGQASIFPSGENAGEQSIPGRSVKRAVTFFGITAHQNRFPGCRSTIERRPTRLHRRDSRRA